MKTILLLLALLLTGAAQAQTSAADKQALAKQLNELMRDPKKPGQAARITLSGCHIQQTIRDEKADVHPEEPINVSYSKGGSGAGFSLGEGVFELKFDFDWADVAAVTYEKEADGPYFQLHIKRGRNGSTASLNNTLYTTKEATVRDLVRRLELVRLSCK